VWTPNIPGTMPVTEVERFGHEVALGRAGQPEERAPAHVYLASSDSSFVTGIILEVTGGKLSSG
nr:SDR family oxidoreductase [Chloroflexia bacterium]